jgi:energy-coupling factor transporter ATP-binding protein EcfA2
MITRIVAKGFKGRDIDIELGPKTIIFGPNGTGKSTIIQALELALNGSISGGTNKTNQAVFDAFASGDKLTVEATLNDVAFGRQLSRDPKGAVPQLLMVNRKRADAKNFAASLGAAGNPRLVVVNDFLELSPTKMITHLAGISGSGDLDNLQAKIQATTNLLNHARQVERENAGYVSRIMAGIAGLNLPPGSLAEVQAEIKAAEKDLTAAKKSLKKAKDEELERKKKAELEAKLEAELEKKRAERLELEKAAPADMQTTAGVNEIPESLAGELGDLGPVQRTLYPQGQETITMPDARPSLAPMAKDENRKLHGVDLLAVPSGNGPADSIQKIIDSILKLSCPTCGGGIVLMTAKAELKKWRK